MFQSFDSTTSREQGAPRLAALRNEMRGERLDWYLVPHADEHQNEYLPARAERLAWLTGFTGSAGFAIAGLNDAFVFSDGRYTVQLRQQTDPGSYTQKDIVAESPDRFLAKVLKRGQRIGFDPWLMTVAQHKSWEKVAESAGAELVPLDNLIDRVWPDQPPAPLGRAILHPLEYSGRSASDKLSAIRETLRADKADFLIMTDPASIAWTFNIRGSDLVHNPLALAFAIIPANASEDGDNMPVLFIDRRKLDAATEEEMRRLAKLVQPERLVTTLEGLASERSFHCDPSLVAVALAQTITENGGRLIQKRDPVSLLRAVKNYTELEGARHAHLRDGVAMVRFLAWLDRQPAGSITEIVAATRLEEFRETTAREMGSELREISFDTISGAGANGAIVHYRVTRQTDATIEDRSLYLVDSGGQYPDGTTDITRTVAIGEPPARAITDFTLVLKGHIAIATARFPDGTRGIDLDPFARSALWQHGKDYAHGTGHGIGSYLNVHEGPQSISRRGMEKLLPGMIISNEPGYYREGEYGIRIENLVIVTAPEEVPGGDSAMLGFETITLCPIDLRLIDKSLLHANEKAWLNGYHARVHEALSPHLDADDKKWLKQATRKL